ncbi:hypothetical protein MUN81_22470 (plasmid) [Hymenobacter sp. 5317J-9]|uniref:hypothetical protein n=1 Tax=Hymenobacter sp. 5317J-9 TaxID=2932250 RepID=UPI001FD6BAEF|nr:hypothetical protein [Hymenobacter sp. 5317J-9]UOR00209.1 hypothetical protein MUN81_22470 [Hymenobacter sp. 5317J-9]
MRIVTPMPILVGLLLVGCQEAEKHPIAVVQETGSPSAEDQEQIQALLRQALHWANSPDAIGLLPVVTDRHHRVYVGVDRDQHRQNLDKLKATRFFSTGFIDNYNRLVVAIDAGMRSGQYTPWLVGDGPTIVFVSEVNAWCLCQDVPYDNPNPWDTIEVSVLNRDTTTAEVAWRWGKLGAGYGPEWKDFSYKGIVTKETGKWQIAYLQGFDLKEGTRQYQ